MTDGRWPRPPMLLPSAIRHLQCSCVPVVQGCGERAAADVCSDACVHQWRLRSSPTYLRECVFERDRGVCALCGVDTHRSRRRIMRLPFAKRMREIRALLERGLIHKRRKSWWEADHITPVVEGGDSNLENMRTLCIPCHRGVTTELRLRRKSPAVAGPTAAAAPPSAGEVARG